MRRILLGLAIVLSTSTAALAVDRWVHIKVEDGGADGEIVRVNVPLALAEKVLPAINTKELRGGKVKCDQAKIEDVDVRAILEAVRSAPDNEFVTVESKKNHVRVAKSGGHLLVKVQDWKGIDKAKPDAKEKPETVDVSIPFTVIDALLSGAKDELDVLAAVRALSTVGDTVLVTVNDDHSKVRIWVDSRNTTE
ncbi:MAG: hypothetical protein ACE145_11740 [Terriglobia bacterium]